MISSMHDEMIDFHHENAMKDFVRQRFENNSILSFCLFAVAVVCALELLNYISIKFGSK